jgi:hypothetical protein
VRQDRSEEINEAYGVPQWVQAVLFFLGCLAMSYVVGTATATALDVIFPVPKPTAAAATAAVAAPSKTAGSETKKSK